MVNLLVSVANEESNAHKPFEAATGGIETQAEVSGDNILLSGTKKSSCSTGMVLQISSLYLPRKRRKNSLTLFLVDADAPGRLDRATHQ